MNLSQQNFFYLVFSGRKTLKIRVIFLSSLCCFLTDYRWLLIVSHWLWRSTTPHTHTHTQTDCGRVNCWWRGDREKMLCHGKTASNRGILQWTKLRLNDTRLQWIFKWKVNKKLKICTVVKKPQNKASRENWADVHCGWMKDKWVEYISTSSLRSTDVVSSAFFKLQSFHWWRSLF